MESDGRLVGRREFATQLGLAGGVVAIHGHVGKPYTVTYTEP